MDAESLPPPSYTESLAVLPPLYRRLRKPTALLSFYLVLLFAGLVFKSVICFQVLIDEAITGYNERFRWYVFFAMLATTLLEVYQIFCILRVIRSPTLLYPSAKPDPESSAYDFYYHDRLSEWKKTTKRKAGFVASFCWASLLGSTTSLATILVAARRASGTMNGEDFWQYTALMAFPSTTIILIVDMLIARAWILAEHCAKSYEPGKIDIVRVGDVPEPNMVSNSVPWRFVAREAMLSVNHS